MPGYVSTAQRELLEHRNRLRILQLPPLALDCEGIYSLNFLGKEFSLCAYNYRNTSNNIIRNIVWALKDNPQSKSLVQDKGCEILDFINRLGLNTDEVNYLFRNPLLYGQVKQYAQNKGYTEEANRFVKKYLSLFATDPDMPTYMQEDGFPLDIEDYVRPYLYDINNCWCNAITYTIDQNDRLVFTSSYRHGGNGFGMVTYGNIAVIPDNHPDKNYLTGVLIQIQRLQAKPYDPNEEKKWVYELQGIGKDPDNLKCRSCFGADKDKAIALKSSETLKFGIAKHETSFQKSVETRYASDKAPYGINDINFIGVSKQNANVIAIPRVFSPRTTTQARIIEKVLIFNYILTYQQQRELQRRGIVTNHDLPPGNPISN